GARAVVEGPEGSQFEVIVRATDALGLSVEQTVIITIEPALDGVAAAGAAGAPAATSSSTAVPPPTGGATAVPPTQGATQGAAGTTLPPPPPTSTTGPVDFGVGGNEALPQGGGPSE